LDNFFEALARINVDLITVLDLALVTGAIYTLLLLIRGTRAVQVLRGMILLALLVGFLSATFELPAFSFMVRNSIPALLVAIPVIFQPELRRALEQLGQTSRYLRLFRSSQENPVVKPVQTAAARLSQRRHGALIVFEQDTGLQEYVDTGVPLEAEVTVELLLTIFNKHTELHDGAVIIREEKLAAAACVMPLSTSSLSDSQMGLRHRAGLGISEVSDAVVLIISEETGQASIAHNGRIIRRQDINRLDDILNAFLQNRGGRRKRST
jgi:diadenylate cyclase